MALPAATSRGTCVSSLSNVSPAASTTARAMANAGSALPRDERFPLFELDVERAMSSIYGADGRPQRNRWHST